VSDAQKASEVAGRYSGAAAVEVRGFYDSLGAHLARLQQDYVTSGQYLMSVVEKMGYTDAQLVLLLVGIDPGAPARGQYRSGGGVTPIDGGG
jgi:hypothetical protein